MKLLVSVLLLSSILTSCSSREPATTTGSQPATTIMPPVNAAGKELFDARCTSCHGSDGTAGIGNAANLHTTVLNAGAIVAVLKTGKGGMPSFNGKLSDEEMSNIADYVLHLEQ